MVAGLELVVGYLIAWSVGKARRAGARLDDDVDLVIDVELDRLHDVVVAKLGADPALNKLEQAVAATGEVSERTRRRVADALADAADDDHEFAATLAALLSELQRVGAAAPAVPASGDRSAAVGRDAHATADHGSVAALTMGDVTQGGPPAGPPRPGRPGG